MCAEMVRVYGLISGTATRIKDCGANLLNRPACVNKGCSFIIINNIWPNLGCSWLQLNYFIYCSRVLSLFTVALLSAGIGYASQVIVVLLNFYYIIVLAWALFYLFSSFTIDLPWGSCDHEWNTGKLAFPQEIYFSVCVGKSAANHNGLYSLECVALFFQGEWLWSRGAPLDRHFTESEGELRALMVFIES